MKTKRIILPAVCFWSFCAWAAAQPPAPGPPPAQPAEASANEEERAEAVFRQAVAVMASRPAVAAKIRQRVELFNQQLVGSGIYLHQLQGDQRRLRLELRVQLDTGGTSLLQVCDGENYWVFRESSGQPSLTRIDLARVKKAQAAAPGQLPPGASATPLGLGGLPELMDRFAAQMRFDRLVESKLQDHEVYVLSGTWLPSSLARLLPDQKAAIDAGQPADLSQLPRQAPTSVTITLGKTDLFPYRIEFVRDAGTSPDAPGDARPIVVVEFFEIQLQPSLNPQEFLYHPGELEIGDGTDAYLHSLGLQPPKK